jgi:hypothetical protein
MFTFSLTRSHLLPHSDSGDDRCDHDCGARIVIGGVPLSGVFLGAAKRRTLWTGLLWTVSR